ncbi:MAG TPA: sugar ABC transporter permease [Candidatus Limnocylindrales bacterium]|nr:sugar ABC transporter permease [Candidatus Limnocylindrales bacterium]
MSVAPAPAVVPRPPDRLRSEGRNWSTLLFLGPAAVLLIVFLVYPTIYTIILSFNRGRRGEFSSWVGLKNYQDLLGNDPDFLDLSHFPPSGALFNNVLWIIFYVGFVLFLGLVVAVMATRVRYESIIKAIVFVPMAVAATALGIIWLFVYSPDPNIGLVNSILGVAHVGPISFLGDTAWVNAALIAVGVWGSVGFATVILSAAIKAIPTEIMEAARTDGANERQIFTRIIVPMVSLPMSVLAVTLIVNVIKLFDLIFVMTGGGPGSASRVVAFTMYQESFPSGQFGKGAAVAVVMLIILVPLMIFNLRRFRTAAVT